MNHAAAPIGHDCTVPASQSNVKCDPYKGLRRSATSATALTILGHTILGFEQSIAQVFLCLFTAYTVALGLEIIDARLCKRPLCFAGSKKKLVDFMLAPHMSAITMSFLLYASSRYMVLVFAIALAISSKIIFRVYCDGRSHHYFNPSNFAISVTLILFPWVGNIPYVFTEGLTGALDWSLFFGIMCLGTLLNGKITRRLPLIGAWLATFVLQAAVRSFIFDTPVLAALMPMTGTAFVLYTFYMITDPATTPRGVREQIVFGSAVGVTYGILMSAHIAFALFFALAIVSGLRGLAMYVEELGKRRAAAVVRNDVGNVPAVAAASVSRE